MWIGADHCNGFLVMMLVVLLVLPLSGCNVVVHAVGGGFERSVVLDRSQLSGDARELLERAFGGLDPERVADVHVHHISTDVNPDWLSWRHPVKRLRTDVYLSAAGIRWSEAAEEQYLSRLSELMASFPEGVRFFLYALDAYHDRDGRPDPTRTPLIVSSESVAKAAAANPERLVPVASVHPYRDDALEALDKWADRGVRYVKWLPNSMGIDPSDPAIFPFYDRMSALNLVLLSHTGHEHAVEVVDQEFGNPLRLRAALERGVTVVALHAASDGTCIDLDCAQQRRVSCFELFIRMMDEPRWEGQLFGEISATTFFNHLDQPLRVLLERSDLHHRLVNGSDYPICAVNIVIQTSALVRHGFLTPDERHALNEVYRYNPLLFDFVVKRTVRHPESGQQFEDVVFELPLKLKPDLPPP